MKKIITLTLLILFIQNGFSQKTHNSYLLYTKNIKKAKKEISSKKGRVTQICTKHVIIASFKDAINLKTLKYSSQKKTKDLDYISQIFVDSWNSPSTNTEVKPQNFAQTATKFTEPIKPEISPSPTSKTLTGSVAVGIIIVSGPDEADFSKNEIQTCLYQTMRGLDSMSMLCPEANVTYTYDIKFPEINIEPWNECDDHQKCEADWETPSLQQLGYASLKNGGIKKYNNDLKQTYKTDNSFTLFFSKYKYEPHYFAYASQGRIVMYYQYQQYGPDRFYQVISHEMCHLFGADDEYKGGSDGCDKSGQYKVPNYNAEDCEDSFNDTCLMRRPSPSGVKICQWTRGQIGWNYGTVSDSISNGDAIHYFDVSFAFQDGKNNYLFALWEKDGSDKASDWGIFPIINNGISNKPSVTGSYGHNYSVAFPFQYEGTTYLFAIADETSGDDYKCRWFISELSSNGDKLDKEVASGNWEHYYSVAFPYSYNGKTYLCALTNQSYSDNTCRWFISELTTDSDVVSKEINSGHLDKFYDLAVPFTDGGYPCMFTQSYSDKSWDIWYLGRNKIDHKVKGGTFEDTYGNAFAFSYTDKHVMNLFLQSNSNLKNWYFKTLDLKSLFVLDYLGEGTFTAEFNQIVPYQSVDNSLHQYIFAQTKKGSNLWLTMEIGAGLGVIGKK